jgi:hypothetical protein
MILQQCSDLETYRPSDTPRLTTKEDWTSVLELSHRWNFASIHRLAVCELSSLTTPVDRVVLGRAFGVQHWVHDAILAICEQETWPSDIECQRLGLETIVAIGNTRDLFHDNSEHKLSTKERGFLLRAVLKNIEEERLSAKSYRGSSASPRPISNKKTGSSQKHGSITSDSSHSPTSKRTSTGSSTQPRFSLKVFKRRFEAFRAAGVVMREARNRADIQRRGIEALKAHAEKMEQDYATHKGVIRQARATAARYIADTTSKAAEPIFQEETKAEVKLAATQCDLENLLR